MASTALFWYRPQPSTGIDTRNATACALARRTISASDRNRQPCVVGGTLGAASAVNSRLNSGVVAVTTCGGRGTPLRPDRQSKNSCTPAIDTTTSGDSGFEEQVKSRN